MLEIRRGHPKSHDLSSHTDVTVNGDQLNTLISYGIPVDHETPSGILILGSQRYSSTFTLVNELLPNSSDFYVNGIRLVRGVTYVEEVPNKLIIIDGYRIFSSDTLEVSYQRPNP